MIKIRSKNKGSREKGWFNEFRVSVFTYLEKLSFLQLFLTFFTIIIVFAVLFYVFSPGQNGIVIHGSDGVSVFDALYFSIVTISSLGYGDMYPRGISKAFSAIEVLLGLALMGMLIAKLTSSRLSYQVKRLYASDANRQLYRLGKDFKISVNRISNSIEQYSHCLVETPARVGKEKTFDELKETIRNSFESNFKNFYKTVDNLEGFINLEVSNGDFFEEVEPDKIIESGNILLKGIQQLNQLFISLADDKLQKLLFGKPGISCNKVIKKSESLSNLIRSYSSNSDCQLVYGNVLQECKKIKENFNFVEVNITEPNPPDQISEGSSEPPQKR